MNILMASTEISPFARTGGLADGVEALAGALADRGHDVVMVMPAYRGIKQMKRPKVSSTGVTLEIPLGADHYRAPVWECKTTSGTQVLFVEQDAFFDRDELYGPPGGAYPDNAARFIFFAKSIVELARRVDPAPDILHVHDWQTALVPVLVKDARLPFPTVLTVHNVEHQGAFPNWDFALTNLNNGWFTPDGLEFYGGMNLLKAGLLHADALTAVSPHYAREILTPEFGCELENVLQGQRRKLTGILEGVDPKKWNPSNDKRLAKTFRPTALSGKSVCRTDLLKKCRLREKPAGPVFAMISRVVEQKGFDLLLPCIDRLLADDTRLIILGRGDPAYEVPLTVLARKYAGKFFYQAEPTGAMTRTTLAGSDMLLAPSRIEPSGLMVMAALKYGVVPVARATGGLFHILQDYDPATDSGQSFLFYDYSPEALRDAIRRARTVFNETKVWSGLVKRAMKCDFTWKTTAENYEAVYQTLNPPTPAGAVKRPANHEA